MVKQHRREQLTLHMSPYNSTAGLKDKLVGQTLSGIGQSLAAAGKAAEQVGKFQEKAERRRLDEEAIASGLTGYNGKLTDEASAKLADASLSAFEELQSANNRIREKYRDNPDGDKMNAELREAYESIREKYAGEVDGAALKKFNEGVDSNMRELIRANYSDARSRKAAIAAKKERELKNRVSDAQQKAIYDAGRKGQPIEEIAAQVIPKELQENPNMPVSAETKRQVEAIPALYVAGQIDKPAYDTYGDDGSLETQGIIPADQIHAPRNFDKIIDDYYDRIKEDIDALPGLTDNQRKKFAEKADLAREMRKQDFARYLGEYKRGATADFMRDPQSDMLDSALFHSMPDGFVEPETEPEQGDETMGTDVDSGQEPKIQWEAKPIKKEMERLADNAYKPSTARTPQVATAAQVVKKLQIPEALDETEMEQQSETALKNVNEILENPTTTNQERIAARQIIANALENPETRQQTNELFVKAQILDQYNDLFNKEVDTDEAFKLGKGDNYLTGVFYDFKTKKPAEFIYAQANEKNKAKYNLVRDTYLNVMSAAAKGDMDAANEYIDALPYRVANINYGGHISPNMIEQFRIIDQSGEQQVRPQFMYKGYSFEYLGMDKTGIIKARRKL